MDFLVEELDRIIGKLTKIRDNLKKMVSISDERRNTVQNDV